jgi:hypothetical protein
VRVTEERGRCVVGVAGPQRKRQPHRAGRLQYEPCGGDRTEAECW